MGIVAKQRRVSLICPHGHPWASNTLLYKSGNRRCRECQRRDSKKKDKAALPVVSPAMAGGLSHEGDTGAAAQLARAEQMVDLLRTRYVSEGWHEAWRSDEAAAGRMLQFFRRALEGHPDDDDEFQHVCDFVFRHGQSLDWILDGKIDGLICGVARAAFERRNRKEAADDRHLLEIVNQIFELKEKIDAFDPEIVRLQNIWSEEMLRLYDASLTGECTLSKEERSAAVAAMPECIEHKRLVELQRPHCEAQDELIKRVLSTRALTPEGKKEKFFVLLNFVMPDGWRENDKRADYDIEQARNFMIELIGGNEAERLREQLA
jgi:hypothetical protein